MKLKIGDKVKIKEESIPLLDFGVRNEIFRLTKGDNTFKISEVVNIGGTEFYKISPFYLIWSYKDFEKIEVPEKVEATEEIDRFELIDFD